MGKYEMSLEQAEAYRENLGLIWWYIKKENEKKKDSHKIIYDEAYDILSDTLIRAIKRHDEKKGKLSTFFCSNARKDMTKYYRKKEREVNTVFLDDSDDLYGDKFYTLSDQIIEIESYLDEYEKTLFTLLLDKYTSREIAKLTGFSKSKVLRDSNKLRVKLEGIIGE